MSRPPRYTGPPSEPPDPLVAAFDARLDSWREQVSYLRKRRHRLRTMLASSIVLVCCGAWEVWRAARGGPWLGTLFAFIDGLGAGLLYEYVSARWADVGEELDGVRRMVEVCDQTRGWIATASDLHGHRIVGVAGTTGTQELDVDCECGERFSHDNPSDALLAHREHATGRR